MMYVVMDGFDLGIGMLFPFVKDARDRDVMMNTVAPVWDGNETWLILGGAALFGAFPLAYAVVLEALYLPLILMLIGLSHVVDPAELLETLERYLEWLLPGQA
ncbi:cytochrome d ubiquinol oxidase subunit II, partial [Mycobacterium tuberculosis]|nr:cytochrome d ubiquinol oxidase subunit II [Mycobacterium tuberculosis]